jgi:hypothetical protein
MEIIPAGKKPDAGDKGGDGQDRNENSRSQWLALL